MRIVAGIYGGRRLRAPSGTSTRPTSDRVREALFSALGRLAGERVLDLFAGTGALGIEALSRGAGTALFVEPDKSALSCLRANLESLGLQSPVAEVRPVDALSALRNAAQSADTYDLVLVDPPYGSAAELSNSLPEALMPVLADGATVVTESDRRAPLELGLEVAFERRYGDTLIRIQHL